MLRPSPNHGTQRLPNDDDDDDDDEFDADKHVIELADGTRFAGVVKGKGVATMFLTSSDGVQHEIMLSDALYVPSYKQSIFSVRAAVKKGVSVNFCPYKCEMKVEGTTFDIQERGKLYYVNSVVNSRQSRRSLNDWHRVLEHCNTRDITKLDGHVDGFKITDKDVVRHVTRVFRAKCSNNEVVNLTNELKMSLTLSIVI